MIKQDTWFISDTHFYHANIIKYCNRPFNNVEEMNQILIDNWNENIKKNDIVYFLGDFSFKPNEVINRLNGNIIFLLGNHDKSNIINTYSIWI